MHNKIHQIGLAPINEDEYLHDFQLEDDWLSSNMADRVSDEVERHGCISELKKRLEDREVAKFNEDKSSFTLLPNAQKSYFADGYTDFWQAVKQLAETMENEFLTDFEKVEKKIYEVSSLFCDGFDDYVYLNEFEVFPFDEFIRKAEIGKPYYIGGIVDYHW